MTQETDDLKISPRQMKFVEEFERTGNATNAAIFAGYSPESARQQASKLLTKGNIKEYRKELQKKAYERAGVTLEMVVREQKKIAFCDARKLYDESGNLLPLSEWDEDTAGAVVGIETETTKYGVTTKKVKLADKKGVLDKFERALGIVGAREDDDEETPGEAADVKQAARVIAFALAKAVVKGD
jgi:phage terminase small subunit